VTTCVADCVVRFSAAAAGRGGDSLTCWPVDGVGVLTPPSGFTATGAPRSVPVSLGASVAIGGPAVGAAVGAGLSGDTLALPGDDSTRSFDRNHLAVMNIRSSPTAIRAPIAVGLGHLRDATGRDSSYDGRSGGSSLEVVTCAFRLVVESVELAAACGIAGIAVGATTTGALKALAAASSPAVASAPAAASSLTAVSSPAAASTLSAASSLGASTGNPRAAQKSSRFFRLVATKG